MGPLAQSAERGADNAKVYVLLMVFSSDEDLNVFDCILKLVLASFFQQKPQESVRALAQS